MKAFSVVTSALQKQGIVLQTELDDSQKIILQDSVTNQFMKVLDIEGNPYLIRMNGKLWPPFTRANEDFNLRQLAVHQINSNVIVNDQKNGFQICRLDSEKLRFSELKADESVLINIAQSVKAFHKLGNFRIDYPLANTINSSFRRTPAEKQRNLRPHYETIMRLLYTLHEDKKNLVSAHNDLLPSSVYVEGQSVTLVDWEYSAMNHRCYDLSLFSIKAALTPQQETRLIVEYDKTDKFQTQHFMGMMKPVVNFLLLLWSSSSKLEDRHVTSSTLLLNLLAHIERAFILQSARKLTFEMRFCFFNRNNADANSRNTENARDQCMSQLISCG